MNLHRQPFGDGCLANSRITDINGIVLASATQHMNRPLDLVVAADQRIDVALRGFIDQVHSESVQRLHPFRRPFVVALFWLVLRILFFFGGDLRYAVRNVIYHIESGDSLLLQ